MNTLQFAFMSDGRDSCQGPELRGQQVSYLCHLRVNACERSRAGVRESGLEGG